MDLNYLLFRHQVSLMRAECASCPESRIAHRRLAAGYAAMIGHIQEQLGASLTVEGENG
jgi:hypothetical protein